MVFLHLLQMIYGMQSLELHAVFIYISVTIGNNYTLYYYLYIIAYTTGKFVALSKITLSALTPFLNNGCRKS